MNRLHLRDCEHPVEPRVHLRVLRLKSSKLRDRIGLREFTRGTQIGDGRLLPRQVGRLLQPVGLHQGHGSLEDNIALLYGFLRRSFSSKW